MSKRTSRIALAAAKLAAIGFAVSVGGWFVVHAQRSANPEPAAPPAGSETAAETPPFFVMVPGPPDDDGKLTWIRAPVAPQFPVLAQQPSDPVMLFSSKSAVLDPSVGAPPELTVPRYLPSSKSLAPGTLIPTRPAQEP